MIENERAENHRQKKEREFYVNVKRTNEWTIDAKLNCHRQIM